MRANDGPCEGTVPGCGGIQSGGCPRGAALRNEIAVFLQKLAQLESAMTRLPAVDENGSSACDFAEDLYAQKEELEQEVSAGFARLSGYLPLLEKEVQRCQKNLERIEADSQRLNRDEARDSYAQAADLQQAEYRAAVQERDALYIALKKAEAVLQVSRTRKFPGREPQRRDYCPPVASDGSVPSAGVELGSEVEDVLSTGPISESPSG